MSYPYDLDLLFHSEKPSCDGVAHLSFSKLDVVGDRVILRSSPYSVSNDYEVIETKDGIMPSFNTQKEAYTEVEFKKSDWDSLPEEVKSALTDLILGYHEVSVEKQVVTFIGIVSSLSERPFGILLTSEPFDISGGEPIPPDCTLTSVTSSVYVGSLEGITYLSSCKVKTYIDGAENKDSSYIPVRSSGFNHRIPVTIVEEDHTKFVYKTEPFKMNVGTRFGTDETVTVIAAFSNPVGITLDELVGRTYMISNSKSFVTFIQGSNTSLEADIPGDYTDPDFQFPVTLTYTKYDDPSVSVQADIYTLDGNRPSTPITLNSNTDRSVTIIKKT
jgi:hypothetical protein